ncbi:helix-turn-helix domain-containing protein [Altererythrobacter sp. H2]|uniref:AraC family transcriptional regulator n=1 Tax=Altererythrobacter sp. H2 TaxID=3108391 RepID=UPI002B4BCC61|nr:helix-turn-helix domain-containing protein [Altererythrobacter sp. H2]WRK96302.1 helix-turn-helix domain-containing protein [Altererythrobacter sp. H2]
MNIEQSPKGWSLPRSQFDRTRDGQLLSINRQPRESLRPWVAHVYGMRVTAPPDQLIACGIFADGPVLRILLDGDWHAETQDGPQFFGRQALYFTPHTRRRPVSVKGSFATVGLALQPGAAHALRAPSIAGTCDRVLSYGSLGWDEPALMARFGDDASVDSWMDVLEDCMERLIDRAGGRHPDPISANFNRIAFENPNIAVGTCAEQLRVDLRKLERVVKRDFGLSPKKVLRRARALDMAANMLGVADQSEAEDLALRYFDQSHLNRDFTEMFGMTPVQFVRTPQPLMRVTLEARQARRLEALERIEEGARRPWQ